MEFRLEEYDPLAKRRAIEQSIFDGHDRPLRWVPIAWVDYDDVGRKEADGYANAMLAGLRAGAPERKLWTVEWRADDNSATSAIEVEADTPQEALKAIPPWDETVGIIEVYERGSRG